MKDKYYHPKAYEFRVGFKYEIFRDDEWKKTSCYQHTIGTELLVTGLDFIYTENNCRVKYLDSDDILSLGFIQDAFSKYEINSNNRKYILFYSSYKNESPTAIYKSYVPIISIDVEYDNNRLQIFRGQVKNINELEVILKQVGI